MLLQFVRVPIAEAQMMRMGEENYYIESEKALLFARNNPDCNISECQRVACKYDQNAFLFARDIPDANISYCQNKTGSFYNGSAFSFATAVPESNIELLYRKMWISERKAIKEFITEWL